MLKQIPYDRRAAVEYALKWAYSANPRYYDFNDIGGDCTNFISQCLYAGCGVMNYSRENSWYYISSDDRSPSWTGVMFLRSFLLTNTGTAVFGEKAPLGALDCADIIQLENSEGRIYHTLIISHISEGFGEAADRIFVCAHSAPARNRRLSSYSYSKAHGIHIIGARKQL